MRIMDYDASMKSLVHRLFEDIYPTEPAIPDRMAYDIKIPGHVTTKVAFIDDVIVGQANIFLRKDFNGNANLGFHVHPTMRKKGVATVLSKEAVKEAYSKGITLIYVKTREDNAAAMRLALNLGFDRNDNQFAENGFVVFVKCL